MAQEQKQQAIQYITGLLETTPFTFEIKAVKKPQGIKITYEVTQEEMDSLRSMHQSKNDNR